MTQETEIPEDVRAIAEKTHASVIANFGNFRLRAGVMDIARAILAEREACAKRAEAAIEGTEIERGFGFAQRIASAIRSGS